MDNDGTITAKQLADKLDGCVDISKDDSLLAKNNNLVIVYGYSDDNIEIEGAIREEVSAYDGGEVMFAKGDIILECDNPCEHCQNEDLKNIGKRVVGTFGLSDKYSWEFEAQDGITAYSFDMCENDDEEIYFCKGLVFDVKEIS